MPIYAYFCENCWNKFELLKPMSEAGNIKYCPKCNEKCQRDYQAEGCSHSWGDALARPETDFSKNIDDAEEAMKEKGLPVGHWVGKTSKAKAKKLKARFRPGRRRPRKYNSFTDHPNI